ncbi:MAG TPA: carbonic anhydrase [Candidatus Saccharimonadales bacterium]|nr:carbonic anhydrase [Candidatus Saccharimonadales bacterium]
MADIPKVVFEYPPVDLDRKKSDMLVVHCSDPRYQEVYRRFIDEKLNAYFDLAVDAGASKAIISDQGVQDRIRLLHDLHNFKSVHVLDHEQCGAFGQVANELDAHRETMDEAKDVLAGLISLPRIAIKGYLFGQKTAVEI